MPEVIESRTQFDDSPQGQAKLWQVEISAAKERLREWHARGDRIVDRFLDKRSGADQVAEKRLNLFAADTITKRALLYGKVPTVDVSRRFADSADDVARVASEMLERILNADLERDEDSYATALGLAVDDRLLAGMGNIRWRYTAEFEPVPETPAKTDPATGAELAPAVPAGESKTSESVESSYVPWKDQLWSKARFFGEIRWWAFRAHMAEAEFSQRFSAELWQRIPKGSAMPKDDGDKQQRDPWARAEVWEVWDKESGRVVWYVDGHDSILDTKDDPLGLDGFWPFPRPLVANVTTSEFVPLPDYVLAQDLYDEIDKLTTRIDLLEDAIRVAGVYDKNAVGIERLLSSRAQNVLIPIEGWAMFAEKGGTKGQIDWLPLDQVVAALDKLEEKRGSKIALLYQITGMSDIMRGQAQSAATATEQSIKAKFGSVRIQAFQDEVARFASDAQRIKAEIVCKHFDPENIIARSNVEHTEDKALAGQAVELLKGSSADFRIEVKPEAVSMTDFAALKQERIEVIQSIAQYIGAVTPLAQQSPAAAPFLLQILQWMVAGLKGASSMESVLDQAIAAAQQAAAAPKPPPPPDPRLEAVKAKSQADQFKAKADVQKTMLDSQAHAAKTKMDMQHERQKFAMDEQRNMWGRNAELIPQEGEGK
ncbi:MAG TPA: hypothetical protein DCP69_10555 [Candidatus Omnitrophica bacterium]|nr:hypothetical protein [Candidatus Omnitrophota bacterium]